MKSSLRQAVAKLRRVVGHRVVRNAALMYLVQFSSYAFPLLSLPYLSHVLSVEKFGLVAFAQTFVWYFLTLTEYGFNLTATRAVAQAREAPDSVGFAAKAIQSTTKINQIFSEVMVAKLLLTLVGLITMCTVVLSVPKLRPDFGLYLIAFLTVVGNLLFPLWLYQGLEKMQHVAMRDFAAKLLSLAGLVIFVHGDKDYLLAAATQSGGLLLAGVISLLRVRKLGVTFHKPKWRGVWGQLRTGWPMYLSLAISAGAGVTNIFLLGLRSPASEVAYYNAAQRIIAAARALVAPVGTAVYPYATQKAGNSEQEVLVFVGKYQWLFIGPFLAGGMLLLITAPWSIPLFLGAKYTSSVAVLQILALTPAMFSMHLVYSMYYMLACGYDRAWMRIMLMSVVLNFVTLIPGLYLFRGSIAVALTGLVVEGFAALMFWIFYYRKSRQLVPASIPAVANP